MDSTHLCPSAPPPRAGSPRERSTKCPVQRKRVACEEHQEVVRPWTKMELLIFYLYFYVPADGFPSGTGEGTVTILVQELVSCSCPHQGPGTKGKGQGIIQRKLCVLWHGCSWELASLLTSCFRFLHPSALPFHGSHVVYFCPNVQTLPCWCKDDLDQGGLL